MTTTKRRAIISPVADARELVTALREPRRMLELLRLAPSVHGPVLVARPRGSLEQRLAAFVHPLRFSSESARLGIGRAPGNHVIVDDAHVSRRHAAIILESERWSLVDEGSANGTSLDGRPLRAFEAAPLRSRAIIELGTSSFAFLEPAPFAEELAQLRHELSRTRVAVLRERLEPGEVLSGPTPHQGTVTAGS